MPNITMPTIETERLVLRPMQADDFEALLAIFTDPLVMASFGGQPLTHAQMQGWLDRNLMHQAEHGYGLFSVIRKADGRLIGDCGLEQMTVDGEVVAELGYDLRSDVWGQGYASEAACAVRDYAFAVLQLPRLISLIRAGNLASRRVAEKAGMSLLAEMERHGVPYWQYGLSKPAGSSQSNEASARPMFDFYTRFYQAVASSAANARYCTLVYGRNLCQHGFADMPDIDHLIQASGITAGSRVLDLGCGNGMIAEYIADQTGGHVTGIDFIEQAILDAQARTQDKRDRLAFHVMDMARLDFPPASFDVIVSIDTLYFGDVVETMRSIIPLLRPGGRLAAFFAECCPPNTAPESYAREQTLPDGTSLAQALQRLGLSYRTWDYSQQMLAHVRRRQPVLQALRPQFEAEGNQFLHGSHLAEANGTERAFANGAGGRYLYLVPNSEPCTTN